MIKANYHTHVLYCHHAVGNVEDYVKQAIKYGFKEIGITDHAPILESFMTKEEYERNWCSQNMKEETVPVYLNDLEEAKKKHGQEISILTGFESEFLPNQIPFYQSLRKKVDYLNLGIHYFLYEGKIINSYDDITYQNLSGYVDAAIKGMETGLFNVLVHPDLFMFGYKNVNGERKFDEFAIKATKQILEAAIKNDVYVEVNANGIKNTALFSNSKEWLYPDRNFWKIAKTYPDLKIIIGADAHDPMHLANDSVQKICDFTKELGLNIRDYMEIKH